MGYYNRYGRATVDSSNPRAFGVCDRCGTWVNLKDLKWQFQWNANQLYNQRILVCEDCYDTPQEQLRQIILPPDPPPLYNVRPEAFAQDETNWLTTQSENILTTESGVPFITMPIPNPEEPAQVSNLNSTLSYPSGNLSIAFLDLFDGNPATTGTSILSHITGSSSRIDISSAITGVSGVYQNTSPIVIIASSLATWNVSYVGIYNSISGGTRLTSGTVSSTRPIYLNSYVQFDSLNLTVNT